ncbi:MAG: antibiotic biosynthesis monooxygenase family protein [Candidatus Eisenbacteria bacterium]
MQLIVWEYHVRPERIEDFEALYRPDGEWVNLFRRSPGFVSTTLLRDLRDPNRFLVSDRWSSVEAYELMHTMHEADYLALDERGKQLYLAERHVGRFSVCD